MPSSVGRARALLLPTERHAMKPLCPRTLQVGDRVRVGKDHGTVYEMPDPSGKFGNGITVEFPGEELPCICEPGGVKSVSRPRKKPKLCPRTLRWAARLARKEQRKQERIYDRFEGHGLAHLATPNGLVVEKAANIADRLLDAARKAEKGKR